MSEANFTKGEWKVSKWGGDDLPIGVSVDNHFPASSSIVICPRFADQDSEEVKANMNLIAAAPDMYEMLTRWLDSFDCVNDDYQLGFAEETKELLAKARGETCNVASK